MRLRPLLFAASLACLALSAKPARADVSSWLFVGGGAGSLDAGADAETHGALRLQLGMGSSPNAPIVVGGTVHTLSFFGAGTDAGLSARIATGGFVRGGWGLALDAGGYQRWWGIGSSGVLGSVSLGAPWGIQAVFDMEMGTNDQRTYAAFLGVDLLRLTVYRTTGTSWFPNPLPAAR